MYKARKSLGRIACLLGTMLFLQSCSLIVINNPTADGYDPEDTGGDAVTIQPSDQIGADLPPKVDNEATYRAYANAYLESVKNKGFYYDGATVILSVPYESIVESDSASDVYSKARYDRNRAVEKAMGIRIAVSETNADSLLDSLQASIRADEYFADLILLQQQNIGTFAAADVLFNLRSAPFLDLSQPYFDAASL